MFTKGCSYFDSPQKVVNMGTFVKYGGTLRDKQMKTYFL